MRRLLAATAITALTLFSTACGSDKKDTASTQAESDDTTADAPEDSTGAVEDTADDGADTTVADEPDETSADTTEGGFEGDVPDLSAQCEVFAERFQDEFDFDNLDSIRDAIQELKSITPDEIDSDLDVLSGVYDDLQGLIDEAGGDATQAFSDPEFLEKLEQMNTPEVQESTENVEAFFDEACPELNES